MIHDRSAPEFLLRGDGKPLRTKIVATIGSRKSYDEFIKLDGTSVDVAGLDLRDLTHWFTDCGVDVIRVNFSHIKQPEQAKIVFGEIKAAILEREREHPNPRRVAVLADLPGPKIRFQMPEPIPISVHQSFLIGLEIPATTESIVPVVSVDQKSLKVALGEADRRRQTIASETYEGLLARIDDTMLNEIHHSQAEADIDVVKSITPKERHRAAEIFAENILGDSIQPGSAKRNLFDELIAELREALQNGTEVLAFADDGKIVFEIAEIVERPFFHLRCKVLSCECDALELDKGFSFKGIDLDIPTFTGTDRCLLEALIEEDNRDPEEENLLTYVALSFVQTADDVMRASQCIEETMASCGVPEDKLRLKAPAIISKIETHKGWRNRNLILDSTDGVMVARGDLGMNVDIETLPGIQKKLIQLSNKRGKPVITATQMLSSMTSSVVPRRAEASDVFNAIQDGTDAVMLSEETAKGRYPLHAITKMRAIAERAEHYFELHGVRSKSIRFELRRQRILSFMKDDYDRIGINERRIRESLDLIEHRRGMLNQSDSEFQVMGWRRQLYLEKGSKAEQQEMTNRITESACILGEAASVAAILTASKSGRTTRMVARMRARVGTIGATHDAISARKLAISYGVLPICVGMVHNQDGPDALFQRCLLKIFEQPQLRELMADSSVILTSGYPLGEPGTTNILQHRRLRTEDYHALHSRADSEDDEREEKFAGRLAR